MVALCVKCRVVIWAIPGIQRPQLRWRAQKCLGMSLNDEFPRSCIIFGRACLGK